MKSSIKTAAIVALAAVAAGCATKDLEKSRTERLEATAAAEAGVSRINTPEPSSNIEATDIYLGPMTPVKREKKVVLPPVFSEQVVIASPNPMSVGEALSMLTDVYGVPTKVEESAIDFIGSIDSNPVPLDGGQRGQGGQAGQQQQQGGGAGVRTSYRVPLQFSGTVEGLLNVMSSRMNISWEWTGDEVALFRTRTRMFNLSMLPGGMDFATDVSNGGSGSSDNSGGQSQVGFTGNSNIWTSLVGEIRNFLSSTGRVNVGETTGSIVVTDTPRVLDLVETYIEGMNETLTQQALFKVEIYEVTKERDQQVGIDWNAVYEKVDDYGLSLVTSATDSDLTGALTGQVIDANSRFNGSEMIVRALHEQGDVSLVQTVSVVAANHQATPVRSLREITYLANSATTQTSDVGTTASLSADTTTEGFIMTLLPMIDGQDIFLQASLELSKVEEIVRVEAGGSAIETPRRRVKNFLQRARMRSGNVLVLSGLEQAENGEGYEGMGPASMGALGGQKSRNMRKATTVILITPYVMEPPKQWGMNGR